MSDVVAQRLGTGFHETFKLDRARLSEVLSVAKSCDGPSEQGNGFSLGDLDAAGTSLGNNMRRAFPRWGVGTGLLEVHRSRYNLSMFGRVVIDRDPTLRRFDTQWIMHYHLSAPMGPGPAFWHHVIAEAAHNAEGFKRQWIESAISALHNGSIGEKLVRSTATIFLRTYVDSAGLGNLKVIRPLGNEQDRYEVNHAAVPPSRWAFAYMLIDHWRRVWPDQLTVRLETLNRKRELANILVPTPSTLNDYLSLLQEVGWIEVFRVAPPFQLVRRWTDPTEKQREALEFLYADDAT